MDRDARIKEAIARLLQVNMPDYLTVNEMLMALGLYVTMIIREACEGDTELATERANTFAEALTTCLDPAKRAAFNAQHPTDNVMQFPSTFS